LRRIALTLLLFPELLPLSLAGCSQSYSPNTYAATAAQQQAAVERGVIIGVRQVVISPDGSIGAAAGGAAGGLAGSQLPGNTLTTAFGAIGGTLVGGISGEAAAKAAGATKGWEYIVQESGDKLVSITQTSKTALPVGLSVLVIAGSQQARIVPDYTVQTAAAALSAQTTAPSPPKTTAALNSSTPTEVNLSPLMPDAGDAEPFQVVPASDASDPVIPAPAGPAAAPVVAAPPAAPAAATAATPVAGSGSSPATVTPAAAQAAPPAKATPADSSATPAKTTPAAATP